MKFQILIELDPERVTVSDLAGLSKEEAIDPIQDHITGLFGPEAVVTSVEEDWVQP